MLLLILLNMQLINRCSLKMIFDSITINKKIRRCSMISPPHLPRRMSVSNSIQPAIDFPCLPDARRLPTAVCSPRPRIGLLLYQLSTPMEAASLIANDDNIMMPPSTCTRLPRHVDHAERHAGPRGLGPNQRLKSNKKQV